jgi:hypothetical protein
MMTMRLLLVSYPASVNRQNVNGTLVMELLVKSGHSCVSSVAIIFETYCANIGGMLTNNTLDWDAYPFACFMMMDGCGGGSTCMQWCLNITSVILTNLDGSFISPEGWTLNYTGCELATMMWG